MSECVPVDSAAVEARILKDAAHSTGSRDIGVPGPHVSVSVKVEFIFQSAERTCFPGESYQRLQEEILLI